MPAHYGFDTGQDRQRVGRPRPTGEERRGVAGRVSGQREAAEARASAIGLPGALNPPPQIENFYQGLLSNRLRSIESLAGGQRQAAEGALEARGLGQSSILGGVYGDIARRSQIAGQQAQSAVQGLRFAQFQGALDFERQKDLVRLQAEAARDDTPWWDRWLNTLGPLAGYGIEALTAGGGGGGGGVSISPGAATSIFGAVS